MDYVHGGFLFVARHLIIAGRMSRIEVVVLQTLRDRNLHRQVFALALPMVLSNITVPLLGLVDAAVIGHLEHAWYLGGVAGGRHHDQCDVLAAGLFAHGNNRP